MWEAVRGRSCHVKHALTVTSSSRLVCLALFYDKHKPTLALAFVQ
jgi:hypothetical protein